MNIPNDFTSSDCQFSIEQARFNMIEQQIRPWGVLNSNILNVLNQVKRELFVPNDLHHLAFTDTKLPIGNGQVMLDPKLEARLLQAANPKPNERIAEIGTGSGYMAALLGFIAAEVVTFEIHTALIESARQAIYQSLLDNIDIQLGCGFKGTLEKGHKTPWDIIILSGSIPSIESLPPLFLDTLSTNGRLIGIIGDGYRNPMMQAVQITRKDKTNFSTEFLFDCDAPALSGITFNKFIF